MRSVSGRGRVCEREAGKREGEECVRACVRACVCACVRVGGWVWGHLYAGDRAEENEGDV
jgi:hypothetical protein